MRSSGRGRAARCRRSTCTAGSLPAPTLLERFGGHRAAAGLSIRPENVEEFARAFAAHAEEHLVEEDLRPVTYVDAVAAAEDGADARAVRGARQARAVRDGQPGGDAARRELRAARPRDRRRGQASAVPGRARAGRSRSASARSSSASRPTVDSTSPSGCRRTTGTAPWRRSSSCGGSSTRRTATWACATGSSREFRKAERDPAAQEIFEELGLAPGVEPRSLLESERFRALLEQPSLARAA